ncbi:MAG: BMC domain-containing protein [Desulfovibrio sp.]|nr:BMC domain-containing protein [Desulfovibrio sp.]MBI4960628.1 BMC domain-containing protein [Desulfovibrio sp.]
MTALGLIETKGLLAAIECADVMLKAANVRLLEKNLAGGGLVTISIAGDVAAVKASVDAAVTAAQRIEGFVLVSSHVIARPDEELSRILALGETPKAPRPTSPRAAAKTGGGGHAPPVVSGTALPDAAKLKRMSAKSLKEIAASLAGFPITQEEMASVSKTDLVEAIIAASRQEEE